jgi:hypothetical protein
VTSNMESVTESYILAFMPLLSVSYVYTGVVTEYVARLQECRQILLWFMNNWQFPFLLYAARIVPDKNIDSTEKRKLSLGTFLWSYVKICCHMWTIMCRDYNTQCVCQGLLNLILKNLFGMITE